jgi:hypothetical protein
MKAALIGIGSLVGGIALIALAVFGMYVSVHDDAVQWENALVKHNKDRENVLSSVTLTIQQTAGVSAKYANDLKDIVKGTYEGRYGNNGSQAAVQFIQERNVNFDTKMALKVQDVIEGGNKEFQIYQTRMLEICNAYENVIGSAIRGSLLKYMGYPKIDVADTCKVISDQDTKDAFKSGVRKPIEFK